MDTTNIDPEVKKMLKEAWDDGWEAGGQYTLGTVSVSGRDAKLAMEGNAKQDNPYNEPEVVPVRIEDVKPRAFRLVFDSNNPNWSPNREYNTMFIRAQGQYMGLRLKQEGRLFVNDVLEILGFEKTLEGGLLGWVSDKGDNRNLILTFIPDDANTYTIMLNPQVSISEMF